MGDTSHPGGTWGAYIEDAARRPGWNSKKLAEAAGVGRATLYRWRSGTTGVTVHSVRKLATALGDDLEHALAAAGGRLEQRAIAHIASDTPGTAMCGEPMPHYEWFALGLADQCDECVKRFKAYRRRDKPPAPQKKGSGGEQQKRD